MTGKKNTKQLKRRSESASHDMPPLSQELILDHLDALVCVISSSGTVLLMNRGLSERTGNWGLGESYTEVLARSGFHVVCPDAAGDNPGSSPGTVYFVPEDCRWYEESCTPFSAEGDGAVSLITLVDVTEKRRAEVILRLQQDLAAALSGAAVASDMARLLLDAAIHIGGFDCGAVHLFDEGRSLLRMAVCEGVPDDLVSLVRQFDVSTQIARLAATAEPLYTTFGQLDLSREMLRAGKQLRAAAIVPVRHRAESFGCLTLASRTRDVIPVGVCDALEAAAVQAGEALAHAHAEQELEHLRGFGDLVGKLSARFINMDYDGFESEIEAALQAIGEFAGVDRCYISVLDEGNAFIETSLEWCAEGIHRESDAMSGAPVTAFPWGYSVLGTGGVLHVPRVSEMPEEAAAEQVLLERQGVRSIVNVPLTVGKRFLGFFGFDMVREERRWSGDTIGVLEIIGHTFGGAFDRYRVETHRRRLEKQFLQAQKLESLGMLAGGIAHDFNNLLVGILGNAGLAQRATPSGSSAHETLKRIETAAQRAAGLTSQLLAYSGKGMVQMEPVSLSSLALETAHLLETVISKKAQLEFAVKPDLPPIDADATQIRQVLMNLITNASDAIGGSAGLITVRTDVAEFDQRFFREAVVNDSLPEGRYVYLEISDDGCGMDAAQLSRIFDPFYTTKETGHGLGLAAALGIVRSHRGAIKVHSEPGKGTTFFMLFPESTRSVRETPAQDLPPPAASWSGEGQILIIDDEFHVREVTREVLEMQGFSVLLAENGQEGVDVFRAHADQISVVLLDMTMPVMDGQEAFCKLREISPDVPVILSSGYTEQDTASEFEGKDLAGFIQKPYIADTLVNLIRQVLAR